MRPTLDHVYRTQVNRLEEALQNPDLNKAYDQFQTSYQKSTGKAWPKDKFLAKAGEWDLHGDEKGFVATRQQASGPIKLVGAAGDPASVKKGLLEVLAAGKPVWGAMDPRMAAVAARMGMVRPEGWIMVRIMRALKDRFAPAMGVPGEAIRVNKDGSLSITYPDVGESTKVLVGNQAYFQWVLKTHADLLPAMVRTALSHLLLTGKAPHPPKDVGDG
jgi:hypothetical protein